MSALAITFRCWRGGSAEGELVTEQTSPAFEYGTVQKIGRAFEIEHLGVRQKFYIEFEFSPYLIPELTESELS